MNNEAVVINSIQRPSLYRTFLASERSSAEYWRGEEKKTLWCSMFPKEDIDNPKLYSYQSLVKVNERWANETREVFLGKADGLCAPGFLNPKKSILIGERAQDNLVALDFSVLPAKPSIAYLKWYAPNTMRWTYAVSDIDTFLQNLKVACGVRL